MCDDVLTLGRGQQHGVARASSLEGARLLKKLTLEEHLAPAAHLVQRSACQHRGAVDVRRYPGSRFPNSSDGENRHHALVLSFALYVAVTLYTTVRGGNRRRNIYFTEISLVG